MALVERISRDMAAGELPPCCQPMVGTLDNVGDLPPFDTLLYIDVLEHIEDDRGELAKASRHLKIGGHLVVLSPAHPFLFSPFGQAIGHYRRYTKSSLLALNTPALKIARIRYLDFAGMLASLGNRLILNQSMPTLRHIAFWDDWLVRISTTLDPLVGFQLGKSVLGVWKKTDVG